MGSQSDYPIMKDCEKILKILKIKYQVLIVSAHITPKRMFQFAESAEKNGFGVVMAGAGGPSGSRPREGHAPTHDRSCRCLPQ
mgnify:CR=1 FL=1